MSNELLTHPNVPRYIKLAEQLRSQVRSRQLKPGDRLPSFTEMKADGVSQNTLERVHALLEREGLVVRERGRGVFVSNTVAVSTPTIGLAQEAFSETHHAYYFANLLAGVQETAQREQVKLTLLHPTLGTSLWGDLDGVLVWEGKPGKPAIVPPEHLPQVSLLLPATDKPSVNITDYAGVRSAMEYLIGLGHRRIAYLIVSDHPVLATRLRAYQEALVEAGIVPDPAWIRRKPIPLGKGGHRMEQGRKSMRQWIQEDWKKLKCTALLVQNDFIALGALEVLKESGYEVPGDISVIGFDGLDVCDMISPRLTTIEVPLRKVGSTALDLLLRQINNQESESHIELPTKLKIQESTAPPK